MVSLNRRRMTDRTRSPPPASNEALTATQAVALVGNTKHPTPGWSGDNGEGPTTRALRYWLILVAAEPYCSPTKHPPVLSPS